MKLILRLRLVALWRSERKTTLIKPCTRLRHRVQHSQYCCTCSVARANGQATVLSTAVTALMWAAAETGTEGRHSKFKLQGTLLN